MSLSTKIISAIDTIIFAFKSGMKVSLKDYSVLETVGERHLTAKDGSLATIFEIFGSTKFIGEDEILEIEENLISSLSTSLQRDGHQLQFVFSRDKKRIKRHIDESLYPYKVAAKKIDLDLDEYFELKSSHISKFCSYESCFLTVWSKPELIKDILKEERLKVLKKAKSIPSFSESQNIIMEYDRLESIHYAFCDLIEMSFNDASIKLKRLDVRQSIRDIRRSISEEYTSDEWEASLPIPLNDDDMQKSVKMPIRDDKKIRRSETDVSDCLWPSISEQIFPVDIDIIDSNVIKVGCKYISPLFIDIPPQNELSFKKLLDSIGIDAPIQISFMLEAGGLSKMKVKSIAASILAITNASNKKIRDSIKELKDLELDGVCVVKLSISAITWSESQKGLESNKQLLMKKLQNWGSCQVLFNTVDPIEGFLETVPALTYNTSATAALAPLCDIIKMLPLTRQAHVWESGSSLFRTYDGKLFPYQPGSSIQTAWNELFIGTPGSGKSVAMNSINFSSILSLGGEGMPIIGMIDIGPTSNGLIQLIRSALPESLKHRAVYIRLQNTQEYAINTMDTCLCCRRPTPTDFLFITSFLTLLLTPAGKSVPYPSTDSMVSIILDKAYYHYADLPDSHPKPYSYGVDAMVDKKLESYNLKAEDDDYSWWSVVDFLFEKKEYRMAGRAQRYAVPILEDLTEICNYYPSIKDTYQKMKIETGETMVEMFSRSLSESIQQYKMLNSPTVLDVSDSNIVSIDLDEVAKGTGVAAQKQTALMMMLARYVVGKNFKVNADEMRSASPPHALSYHIQRAFDLKNIKKRLCIDEFHRGKDTHSFVAQVKIDQKEGRKHGLQVALSSQLIEDFDPEIIALSTNVFIISGGGSEAKKLTKIFDFNKTTERIIKNRLNGPTAEGVPFVLFCKTESGEYTQYLYSTISPFELWSLSTTTEDDKLRSLLTEELGSANLAKKILAEHFPSGSAKKKIESLQRTSKNPAIIADPYSYIIKRLKEMHSFL